MENVKIFTPICETDVLGSVETRGVALYCNPLSSTALVNVLGQLFFYIGDDQGNLLFIQKISHDTAKEIFVGSVVETLDAGNTLKRGIYETLEENYNILSLTFTDAELQETTVRILEVLNDDADDDDDDDDTIN